MHLHSSLRALCQQLTQVLQQISAEAYTLQIDSLSGASIGEHVRHILELFTELENGLQTGIVNYDLRKRDLMLQQHKEKALVQLASLPGKLPSSNQALQLAANEMEPTTTIPTNYYRELLYNIEHTIHHMALIRVALIHLQVYNIPNDFGYAPATIKYREACAQ